MTRHTPDRNRRNAEDFSWSEPPNGDGAAPEVVPQEHYFGTSEPVDDLVHGHLLGPDAGGNDDVAELVATEMPGDDDLSAEEAALHTEVHDPDL